MNIKRLFSSLKTTPKQTQFKPNLRKAKMNLNPVMTKYYEQKTPLRPPAKQTQNKPNQTQFRACRQNKESQPENSQLASEEGDDHSMYILGVVIQLNVEKLEYMKMIVVKVGKGARRNVKGRKWGY